MNIPLVDYSHMQGAVQDVGQDFGNSRKNTSQSAAGTVFVVVATVRPTNQKVRRA